MIRMQWKNQDGNNRKWSGFYFGAVFAGIVALGFGAQAAEKKITFLPPSPPGFTLNGVPLRNGEIIAVDGDGAVMSMMDDEFPAPPDPTPSTNPPPANPFDSHGFSSKLDWRADWRTSEDHPWKASSSDYSRWGGSCIWSGDTLTQVGDEAWVEADFSTLNSYGTNAQAVLTFEWTTYSITNDLAVSYALNGQSTYTQLASRSGLWMTAYNEWLSPYRSFTFPANTVTGTNVITIRWTFRQKSIYGTGGADFGKLDFVQWSVNEGDTNAHVYLQPFATDVTNQLYTYRLPGHKEYARGQMVSWTHDHPVPNYTYYLEAAVYASGPWGRMNDLTNGYSCDLNRNRWFRFVPYLPYTNRYFRVVSAHN